MHPLTPTTPAPVVLAQVATAAPLRFRAVGWRVGAALEVSIYHGDTLICTLGAAHPSTTLAALVAFVRSIRATGAACSVTLRINPDRLPF